MLQLTVYLAVLSGQTTAAVAPEAVVESLKSVPKSYQDGVCWNSKLGGIKCQDDLPKTLIRKMGTEGSSVYFKADSEKKGCSAYVCLKQGCQVMEFIENLRVWLRAGASFFQCLGQ